MYLMTSRRRDGNAATAARNSALFELLAVVDAVRLGRARERTRAKRPVREQIAAG